MGSRVVDLLHLILWLSCVVVAAVMRWCSSSVSLLEQFSLLFGRATLSIVFAHNDCSLFSKLLLTGSLALDESDDDVRTFSPIDSEHDAG